MADHIIFIHGRAPKPWVPTNQPDFKDPQQIAAASEGLRQHWLRALLVGLARHASADTFRYWNDHQDRVHMAYYGDMLNVIAGKSDGLVDELTPTLDDLIERTENVTGGSTRGFIRDQGVTLAAFISQGLGFKDNVLLSKVKDLRAYVKTHSTGSDIRARLHGILDPLLAGGERVAILAHSLGSLVAYDALWKISHRSELSELASAKVDLFATMGSPLGNEAFLNVFRIDSRFDRDSQFPRNIRRWRNFTTRGDFVAHDAKLKGDFYRRRFLKHLENRDLVDHVKLFNPYHNREGKWNPHKSFGYLIQQTLAVAIDEFTT